MLKAREQILWTSNILPLWSQILGSLPSPPSKYLHSLPKRENSEVLSNTTSKFKNTKSNVCTYVNLDVPFLVLQTKRKKKKKRYTEKIMSCTLLTPLTGFTEEEQNDWNKHPYWGRGRMIGGGAGREHLEATEPWKFCTSTKQPLGGFLLESSFVACSSQWPLALTFIYYYPH